MENNNDTANEIIGKTGMDKESLLKSMLEEWYKATPELEKELPKKNSKILENLHKREFQKEPTPEKTTYSGKYNINHEYKFITILYYKITVLNIGED